MYANTYVATEQLHNFYMNADLIEVSAVVFFKCLNAFPCNLGVWCNLACILHNLIV